LKCEVYKAVEENSPNMIFVDYKEVDKLQKLLAKHLCPELLTKPIRINDHSAKKVQVYVNVTGSNSVHIDEWLEAKRGFLELALKSRSKATCQAKTRRMEDNLFGCSHGAVKVPDGREPFW
jgi:hypothetical protein